MNDCPGEFYNEHEDYDNLNLTIVIYRSKENYLLLRKEFETMQEALNFAQSLEKKFVVIGVVRKNYPVTV